MLAVKLASAPSQISVGPVIFPPSPSNTRMLALVDLAQPIGDFTCNETVYVPGVSKVNDGERRFEVSDRSPVPKFHLYSRV